MSEPFERSRPKTRSRLLEAAYTVFADVGIELGTVEMICDRANFSRGAFYSNFGSKDEIVIEAVKAFVGQRLVDSEEFVDSLVHRGFPADPADAIRQIAAKITGGRAGIIVMNEVRMHGVRDERVAHEYLQWQQGLLAQVQVIVQRFLAAYELQTNLSASHAAELIFSVWQHTSLTAAISGLNDEEIALAVGDATAGILASFASTTAMAQTPRAPSAVSMLASICVEAAPRDPMMAFADRIRPLASLEMVQTEHVSVYYRVKEVDVQVIPAADGTIATITYGADFPAPVNGVSIGDAHERVTAVLGDAHRTWPAAHPNDILIWDTPAFFRVDVDRETSRVARIWR
ncbi:TetR/AcrR family transcriptional regulator [Microbacterium sp. NPDC076911]|uniref:TetR/AcrR family transcriptional regulator n=1 Tax=Microbacterium sp. NPDC076911 TaxID=3154958 RepID=UPI003427A209